MLSENSNKPGHLNDNEVSAAALQSALKGIDYPASRQDLLRQAQKNDATEAIMDVLNSLPGDRFGGPQDVMKAFGQVH